MEFKQHFSVRAVGQGLFYTGKIKYGSLSDFRFVFDCGSDNILAANREVAAFRSEELMDRGRLDMLVISHFDADHVSHIKKLLEGGVKIDRLVMPFMLFEERLFLVLRGLNLRRTMTDNDFDSFRLILDPLGTLRDNLDDGSEIYFITGSPSPLPVATVQESRLNETELNKGFNDKGLSMQFPGREELGSMDAASFYVPNLGIKTLYSMPDSRIPFVYDHNRILMEFLFYKKDLGLLNDRFFKEVAEMFYEMEPTISPASPDLIDQIIEVIKKKHLSAGLIRKLFVGAARNVGLRSSLVNDLNITSLCMLHRNIGTYKRPMGVIDLKFSFDYRFSKHLDKIEEVLFHFFPGFLQSLSVLMTSDGFFKTISDLEALKVKFHHYFDECTMVQIPHHGSSKNMTLDFYSLFQKPTFFFVNYGATNKHGHPSPEIFPVPEGYFRYNPFLINEFQGLSIDLKVAVR